MLENTGVPTQENIDSVFPSKERMEQGPVAVIECYQNIPCNPCSTACNRSAIQPFTDINDRPLILSENCNGCSLCVSKCPGLAIMILHYNYSEDKASIRIPYEFRPLPEKGQIVKGLDRAGNYVADCEVISVANAPAMDKTPIVGIAFPKEHYKTIRNIGGVV